MKSLLKYYKQVLPEATSSTKMLFRRLKCGGFPDEEKNDWRNCIKCPSKTYCHLEYFRRLDLVTPKIVIKKA